MAEISMAPGELNISYMNKGYAFAFQTIHDGDITSDTFVANIIQDVGPVVSLAITKTYDIVTLKTTLTYTLTAVNSALLVSAIAHWNCVQTSGGVARPILAGKWGTYSL